jgi:hypothetical protein
MARRPNPLNVTRLEGRELMTTGVSAFVLFDVLHVREDDPTSGPLHQSILITRTGEGKVRVSGLVNHTNGRDTLVNGQLDAREFSLSPSGNLNVKLSRGDNNILIAGDFGSVTVTAGGLGSDAILDADRVSIHNVRTRAGMQIHTGGGDDSVTVTQSRIGDGQGTGSESLVINTGGGADTVRVGSYENGAVAVGTNLYVKTNRSAADQDVDVVSLIDVAVGRMTQVSTGGGNDELNVDGLAGEHLAAVTGFGDDTVRMNAVSMSASLVVKTSDGNDTLETRSVSAIYLTADGGLGFDRLNGSFPSATRTKQIVNWEAVNGHMDPRRGCEDGLLPV